MSRYIKVLNEEGTFTEKKVYLDEDMEAFWRWADANGWYYGNLMEMWYNDDGGEASEGYTIEEVLKIWEESK